MSWKAHLQPQVTLSLPAEELECVRGEWLWVKIILLLLGKAPALITKHFQEHLCCSPTTLGYNPCGTGLKESQQCTGLENSCLGAFHTCPVLLLCKGDGGGEGWSAGRVACTGRAGQTGESTGL